MRNVKLFTFIFFLLGHLGMVFSQEKQQNQKVDLDQSVGVDFDQQDPFMDAYYQKGSHLLYDCVNNHWVCTTIVEFNQCIKMHKEALLDYMPRLRCVHYKEYDSRKKCRAAQVEYTSRAIDPRFCLHPKEKVKLFDI